MADIFYSRDAIQLLQGKKLYLIGDSNIRALYKDIICLLNGNRLLTEKQLKAKAEKHFLGDVLLRGSPLTKGRAYREDRRFLRDDLHVEFHFVTKCLNDDIKTMMSDFRERRITPPDIIVMNSTQWDVNRWGPRGVELFKDNMLKLMHLFKSSLPPSTLIIWVTAPPISVRIIGGYMIKQLEFAQFTMRFHVMEANTFAKELMDQFGFNCLDFHYHLQWQVHWRLPDGMHWSSRGMRFLGNLLLTHIALALGVPLPGNYHTNLLSKHKALARNRAAADAAKDIPKQANEEATSMKTSEEATKEASMKTSEEAPKAMAVRQSTAGLPSPPRVRNPRPRVAVPVRRQQQQQQQQQQQPYNHDERVFWRPRQPRREVVWDRGHSSHSMGSPMGQPMVPPMGHPMGHQMGPPMGHHMGPPMGHGLRPPRPQYAGGYFVHGGQLGGPPLPAYPAPELPPLPSGPEPGDHYANDDWGDNAGAFFTTFSEPQPPQPPQPPQQIQSLWGPVRPVRQGHAGRRPRPY